MFNTMLPIHIKENTSPDDVLSVLDRVGAAYAVLSFDDVIMSSEPKKYKKKLATLSSIIPILKSHGYGVGIYLWSLWLTDVAEDELLCEAMLSSSGKPRIRRTALNSNVEQLSGFICPTSAKTQTIVDIISCAAQYEPDFILLNDDLGYSTYLGGIGCYCKRHIETMSLSLGRDISREEIRSAVLCGQRNETRDLWLKLQGETIENYARAVRAAIDGVDPTIRCGLCTVMSNWSGDGINVETLARIMAGNTRPLIRLIGAPYWGRIKAWGNRLHHTVELIRMESAWIDDGDIELIAEGDVFPRPRHAVPASFLEHYDTAIRASGCCDGILKIMLDYTASIGYETGYVERHVRNGRLYSEIDRIFKDKTCRGVRVYERMNKAEDADFTGIDKSEEYASNLFFSYAARFLSDNSFPTKYTGGGVGIAFGENARNLPNSALDGGLILDIRAARILTEQGIDVGIESFGGALANNNLYFPDQQEKTITGYRGAAAYEMFPRDGARVVTYSIGKNGRSADAIEYENALGQRFLVYAFDAAFVDETRYRSYATQKQLFTSLEWLSKGTKPIVCLGNPDLYTICKENADGMAIGLWNMFEDEMIDPAIALEERYTSAEFINCEGQLEQGVIRLSTIPAYGCAFISLKK